MVAFLSFPSLLSGNVGLAAPPIRISSPVQACTTLFLPLKQAKFKADLLQPGHNFTWEVCEDR